MRRRSLTVWLATLAAVALPGAGPAAGRDDGESAGTAEGTVKGGKGKIAFTRLPTPTTPAVRAEIWVMNGDGSNARQVTCNNSFDFGSAWSPDGHTIAFHSNGMLNGLPIQYLYLIDPDDACGPGTLVTEGRFPSWSPNGKKIAFDRGRLGVRDIFVIDEDGVVENLTNDAAARNIRADWSHNGQRIVFARGGENAEDIYVMNADGTEMTRLTDDPAGDNAPQWSPNGRQIVFQSDRDGNDEIYVMNPDGSGQTRLTHHAGRDLDAHWSPNGRHILFHRDMADQPVLQLFVMNADGSEVTQITDLPTHNSFPAWGQGRLTDEDHDDDQR